MIVESWWAVKGFFAARKWIGWVVLCVAIAVFTWLATRWIDNWFDAQAAKDQQRIALATQLAVANTTAQVNAASAESLEQQMLIERQRYDTLQQETQAIQTRARQAESRLRELRRQLTDEITTDPKAAVARMNATLAAIQAQLETPTNTTPTPQGEH